jgi:hypothetical protein
LHTHPTRAERGEGERETEKREREKREKREHEINIPRITHLECPQK